MIDDIHKILFLQAKRLQSPSALIMNADAALLPNLKEESSDADQKMANVRFDRVLADVPCSGDGTLRCAKKHADVVWKCLLSYFSMSCSFSFVCHCISRDRLFAYSESHAVTFHPPQIGKTWTSGRNGRLPTEPISTVFSVEYCGAGWRC